MAKPTGEEERRELVRAIVDEFERRGTPDAEMLRRVARMREAVVDLDRELDGLRRYFTAGASPANREEA